MSESEISKLRAQLDEDAKNLRLLAHGYKTVGSHQIISHAYDRLGATHERLAILIGEHAAMQTLVDMISKQHGESV
jgi:hypothetical protein